jgi:uncharacterized cupredoxin-like copper-binding protein
MKRIALFVFMVSMMVLATACGGSAPTEAPTQPIVTEAPAQPTAIEATPTSASTQVEILLTDNKIASSLTAFQVGVPYSFIITNAGKRAHNFNISTPVPPGGSFEDAVSNALLAINLSQLPAGAIVTAEFVFPESAAGATLEFACLIRSHYRNGMLLPITVTP